MKTIEEIEVLAEEYAKSLNIAINKTEFTEYAILDFTNGYKQCQEDMANKKYTEEDLGLFLEYVRDNYTGMGAPHLVHNKGGQRKTKAIVEDFIHSLNKQD